VDTTPPAFPYRSSSFHPQFESQHRGLELLAAFQKAGHIRHCGHARVGREGDERHGYAYYLKCGMESFEASHAPVQGQPPFEFRGCPKGCRLYTPRWRYRLNAPFADLHPLLWFDRQPWQVKVAILALPVLGFAIYFRVLKDLVEVVRTIAAALQGK
jgi:hypothetical protein